MTSRRSLHSLETADRGDSRPRWDRARTAASGRESRRAPGTPRPPDRRLQEKGRHRGSPVSGRVVAAFQSSLHVLDVTPVSDRGVADTALGEAAFPPCGQGLWVHSAQSSRPEFSLLPFSPRTWNYGLRSVASHGLLTVQQF